MTNLRLVRSLAVATLLPFHAALGQGSGYKVQKRIVLGGEGHWDYLAVDTSSGRLFVAHGTQVEVVDLSRDSAVGEIPQTHGVHAMAFAPALGRGFVSAGRDTAVVIFDLRTLATIGIVKVTGLNPDAIAYEPVSKRVFSFNGRSANATALDAATGAVVGTIPLDGKPEVASADLRGFLFVNVEDKSEIQEIDARALKVTRTWSLAPCEEPSGLAIDLERRRLFSGCDNRVMAISDADAGKVIATVPIGGGVDAAAFDPVTRFAFTSNGEGSITVIREDAPDMFTVVDNVATQRGARTMALDPRTHRLFVATAEFGPAPAPTAGQPRPRPPIVPGTFTVIVLAR
jgi:DNA-binding beta-propeller fold protein YncE